MEKVACPGCGRQAFSAVAFSECYCSCGTTFRIADNGAAVVVNAHAADLADRGSGVLRKLLRRSAQKTGTA